MQLTAMIIPPSLQRYYYPFIRPEMVQYRHRPAYSADANAIRRSLISSPPNTKVKKCGSCSFWQGRCIGTAYRRNCTHYLDGEGMSPVSAYFSALKLYLAVLPSPKKLSSTYAPNYSANMGFLTNKVRLQYTVPEDAGVNSANLLPIDAIACDNIATHSTIRLRSFSGERW